ncbi:MAG TPA: FAD-dependent oxidoreductase [Acidimicrobiales bacterium]|nr:FAD-dependent oxidoreductase [Acidimicrobiales bacterium]
MDYDLVVIGGGTGGLSAAREAARRGASVLLVQQGRLGGDCTFTGCVPSKALLSAAARGEGFSDAMAGVQRAVETIAVTEDDDALKRQGVEVLHGWATFRSPQEIDVDGRPVRSPRCVVATGARPAVPPIEGLRELRHLTNENLFELDRLPPRLAVLGGGAIGAEMSQAFAHLGSEVTLIEAEDRILTKEEPEASAVVAEALGEGGIIIRVGGKVSKVDALGADGAALVHIDGGAPVEADRVLVAIGRKPSARGFGLEDVGVELDDRGFVRTDDAMATSAPGIWAVGDVAGKLQFTHAANRMATVAVRNALSPWAKVRMQRFDASVVPWVTFTSPEVGRIGMTEAESVAHGGRVAYLPMAEVDRAVATGQTRGFLKLIAGPRPLLRGTGGGRLLGATAVAATGGELVHEVALGMRTKMFTGRLAQTVHAYPTWSMAVQKAAAQFFVEVDGRAAKPARG